MVKSLKIDKVNGIATVEINKDELRYTVYSVDNMVKQQRILLEYMPSDEEDSKTLDNYKALREDLGKILESIDINR
jgi:hypothetical protein